MIERFDCHNCIQTETEDGRSSVSCFGKNIASAIDAVGYPHRDSYYSKTPNYRRAGERAPARRTPRHCQPQRRSPPPSLFTHIKPYTNLAQEGKARGFQRGEAAGGTSQFPPFVPPLAQRSASLSRIQEKTPYTPQPKPPPAHLPFPPLAFPAHSVLYYIVQ